MATKRQIMDSLSTVEDPELGMSIVDLGLIYAVKVERKVKGNPQKINIKMTFTTPACPMMNDILDRMKMKLEQIKNADIDLQVVFEPLWTPERMSRKARIKLGMI